MPFELFRNLISRNPPVAPEPAPPPLALKFVRNVRARRYILRLQSDGMARVTIPRGGSLREAQQFAARHQCWIAQARCRPATLPTAPREWRLGTTVWFRGENLAITRAAESSAAIQLGPLALPVADPNVDLRSATEAHSRGLAETVLRISTACR